jgi:hypothetical protein
MELNCRPQLGLFELNQLKIWAIFKYINSLSLRDDIFRKNMSKIPVANGSSLNKLITLKIEVLANITITKTSVLVVYLLVYYSIYYPPLLCTSCNISKICLPPMYNVIESSPNDQIPPKLLSLTLLTVQIHIFCLISLYWTNRYPWRFDSIHSHCHDDVNSFSFNS